MFDGLLKPSVLFIRSVYKFMKGEFSEVFFKNCYYLRFI